MSVGEDKFSIYDDSIIKTLNNVKTFNFIKYYTFYINNKYFKPEFKANYKDLTETLKILNMKVEDIFDVNTLRPLINDIFYENINIIQDKLIEYKTNQINLFINEHNNILKNNKEI